MGKSANRIKAPKTNKKGSRITITPQSDYEKRRPKFSLSKICNGSYCFSALTKDDKAAFADSIFKRRNLDWSQIKQNHRHKLGFEKIAVKSIKAPVPLNITDDRDHFLAFRYNGMKAMIGYRIRDVFYILWFDHNFTAYKHK